MKKYSCKQGSDEWLSLRAGVVTASELDQIVTPLFVPRAGEMVETYLSKKIAERWLGMPLQSFHGGSMEQGTIREEEALPFYEFSSGREITRIGFITTDDGKFGCSPDGLFADGTGIEVKCPEPHTHCKYLLAGKLPKEYAAQVYGSMAVTGAADWTFLSYCRNLPPLVLRIKSDPEIIKAITGAVDYFNARLDAAYARLVELNGGPPDRARFCPQWKQEVRQPLGSLADQAALKEWMAQ